ncbi:MAG: hypothetical protein DI551_10950 [Micavibrio aeruginosavorus]|uniref:Xcc1710-like domain-containing protein n=1 Tax=Micavibrio aeruginosavorus TaxID=349221 RepID=A0A2W5MS20_9BACT|nr:MAG: hypothetical protein DI551_10950 [Micavibrio aeruginosavorus]
MDVTPLIPEGRQIIQGYSADGFKVSGKSYDGAIIVTPAATSPWDAPVAFAALDENSFTSLTEQADDIDVVLLGSGVRGEFFPPKLRQALKEKGLVIETMDTGAACRTYNVLMAEGRRVVAALMPLQ